MLSQVGFLPIPETPADTIVLGLFMICLSVSINDLLTEFWSDPSYSAEDAQSAYADIIENAD